MSLLTLAFNGSVSAGSEVVLTSKRLGFPFLIRKLHASFALGTNRTNQIRFFLSPDDSTPATGKPSGTDLLESYSHTPYLVGDDEQKNIPQEIPVTERNYYLKVYANNTDTFDHTVDAQIIIDTDPPEFKS